jgi:hypothetical protein
MLEFIYYVNEMKKSNIKLNTEQMEKSLLYHFSKIGYAVCPRFFTADSYEKDLMCVNLKEKFGMEIEIKISLSDFKADFNKKHKHNYKYNKYFYFAIPAYLYSEKIIELLSENSGLLLVFEKNKIRIAKRAKLNKNFTKIDDKFINRFLYCSTNRFYYYMSKK